VQAERAFISIRRAGEIIGVGETQARRLADANLIPTTRITRGKRVVPIRALEEWLERKSAEALASVEGART